MFIIHVLCFLYILVGKQRHRATISKKKTFVDCDNSLSTQIMYSKKDPKKIIKKTSSVKVCGNKKTKNEVLRVDGVAEE